MQKVLMHKNCMDVALDVLSIRRYKPGHVDLKGRWLNLGYVGKPYYISETVKLRVSEQAYKDWLVITNDISRKRSKPGIPDKDRRKSP